MLLLLLLLLVWFLLYLMSAFAAYRLKRVHPWRRRQAGWWSGSQSCACVVGDRHCIPWPGHGQRTSSRTRTRTRTHAGQWCPVSLRFRLSWQFIQLFFLPGYLCSCACPCRCPCLVACNGNLSAHLLMRLALLCGLVGNVKLIYNFPALHFNFSCCQHASCLPLHFTFAFCIRSPSVLPPLSALTN